MTRQRLDLFLISFAILFLELACIRWFSSYIVFMAFFSNLVLIASFVGMSIGCLAARRRFPMVALTPLLLTGAVGLALWMRILVHAQRAAVTLGSEASSERIYFGTLAATQRPNLSAIPIEAVAVVFFALLALCFVGPGQVLGQGLSRFSNRLEAYVINIGGSLVGIVGFTLLSAFSTPPVVWFLVGLATLAPFLAVNRRWRAPNFALLLICLGLLGWAQRREVDADHQVLWSPYYRITLFEKRDLNVNDMGHQWMIPVRQGGLLYALPYRLLLDAGQPRPRDVLIIGAGTGNDVSRALWYGARHVDAVEIDPVILGLGRRYNPDRPYEDPRVTLVADDGRSFLRTTSGIYDLIAYGLVDSLTLQSAYSSVRLENYLFTREALADVKAHLKPGGVFVMYNFFRTGWLVVRLHDMVREVFGAEPVVISLPYERQINPNAPASETVLTVILAGGVEQLRRQFGVAGAYWVLRSELGSASYTNGFEVDRAAFGPEQLHRIGPSRVPAVTDLPLPSDDWPFLYLHHRAIPPHAWRLLGVMLVLSLVMLLAFAPVRSHRISGHFFFLGAGFMLIETKSITRMALLFGSTWLVNAIVFAAILIMILLSNLYVIRRRPRRLTGYYIALGLALLVEYAVGLEALLGYAYTLRLGVSCLMVFAPIFFAGIIFATSFRDSENPDLDFGANTAGVVLGGLLEYASLILGYRALLLVALALYALSMLALRGLGARAPRAAWRLLRPAPRGD